MFEVVFRNILHIIRKKKLVCICDLDGTLCLIQDRGPFDFKRCGEDLPNLPVLRTLQSLYSAGYSIVFVSGRKDFCRPETEEWLKRYWKHPYELYMRKSADNRNDGIVKEEIYINHIAPRDVLIILDDRPRVIRKWMKMRLPVFNVNGISEEF